MGIHTGEGVMSDRDYVGMDVHFVARVASAGHGGQVLISAAAATALSEDESTGIELEDLGDHRLKDLGSQHLSQLRIAGLPVDFPPLATEGVLTADLVALARDELKMRTSRRRR